RHRGSGVRRCRHPAGPADGAGRPLGAVGRTARAGVRPPPGHGFAVYTDGMMTTRSLLLVTYHFPPSAACGGYRIVRFCTHLPHPPARRRPPSAAPPPPPPCTPPAAAPPPPAPATTRVVETPSSLPPLGKPIRKFFPYAAWLPRALSAALREAKRNRPDAVL